MDGVIVRVRVTPRADRSAVTGVRAEDGVILIRVQAAPADGNANRACVEVLAGVLGVKPGQVSLLRGHTARDKQFAVSGLTEADLTAWRERRASVGDAGAK